MEESRGTGWRGDGTMRTRLWEAKWQDFQNSKWLQESARSLVPVAPLFVPFPQNAIRPRAPEEREDEGMWP